MAETSEPLSKLYYFSAAYGELGRILNWTWDRDLAVLRYILEQTYQAISSRTRQIMGGDAVVQMPSGMFDLLTAATEDLSTYVAQGMKNQGTLYDLMGRFVELGYVTTGNGHYLLQRGLIKLQE
jgi:hypothetical protein